MSLENNSKKYKIPKHIYLIYLLIFTFLFTGVTFSKYIATSTGNDGSRIVKFGDITLTETGDFDSFGKMIITPGVNLNKKADVSFENSETASYIFLKVETGSSWIKDSTDSYTFNALNKNINWAVDNTNWTFLKDETVASIYYMTVPANTQVDNKNILKGNLVNVSSSIKNSDLKALVPDNMDIKFTAYAMQYDGSSNETDEHTRALKAWNLVSSK